MSEMQSILRYFTLTVCALLIAVQTSGIDLQSRRDSLIKAYILQRDTVTVRTWVNVITSNKYLEQIRVIDSVLLLENSKATEKPYQMINELQDEIDSLILQNKIQNARPITLQARSSLGKTTYLFIILISVIFVTLFVLLFFGYSAAKRKARNRDNESRNFLTKLNIANDEIEKMQQTEKDLAHKFNLMKTDYEEKFKKLMHLKSAVDDEKLLIENQITEIKKAYDHEVLMRMEIESEVVLLRQKERFAYDDTTEKIKLYDLEEKNRILSGENEKINTALDKALTALQSEVNLRVNAEIAFNNLIVQLEQNGFLQDGNPDISHISNQIKRYSELIAENDGLTKALDKTRSEFQKELAVKKQLEDDLRQIILRFNGGN